jgi:Na+-driven multidrug efflux pump
MRLDWACCAGSGASAFPLALQQAVTSFSNVFVQSYINQFGSAGMAGWASYSKIDQFALLPMQSLSLSATTFVGRTWARATSSAQRKAPTARWSSP